MQSKTKKKTLPPKTKTKAKTKTKQLTEKPIGSVMHYYTKLGVAIIKFKERVRAGDRVRVKGATSDFIQTLTSLERNRKTIRTASKNQQIGVKVRRRVREGDTVYRIP